jgi:hypothetical protein
LQLSSVGFGLRQRNKTPPSIELASNARSFFSIAQAILPVPQLTISDLVMLGKPRTIVLFAFAGGLKAGFPSGQSHKN